MARLPDLALGDRGVSQETEHKYRDPNNSITRGAIRPRILEAYPWEGVCVWRGVAGDWMVNGGVWVTPQPWVLLIGDRSCYDMCYLG